MKRLFTTVLATALAVSAFTWSAPTGAMAADAELNYRFYCAQCHGLEGRGDGPNATRNQPVDPRDHTSAYEMSRISDEDLVEAIAEGGGAVAKSHLMPPFGGTLTDQEILELRDYIRDLCDCAYGEE